MSRAAACLAAALAASAVPAAGDARPRRAAAARGFLVLAGERVPVRWTDGDSFRIGGGRFAGRAGRLLDVNALEAFGPIHRIGAASPRDLLAVARATPALAAGREWRCDTGGESDRYGRLLVRCPAAAEALVGAGHAMVFAVDAPADAALLVAQRRAQRARAGMWAGGAPPLVPTSLHSAGEEGLGAGGAAYDRIVDTRTGAAGARPHDRRYAPCEEVCVGEGRGRACMTYVPFERRYRNRPRCLR